MAPSARERRSAGLCKAKSPHLQAKVRFTVRRLGRLLMAHSRLAWAHLVAGKYGAGAFTVTHGVKLTLNRRQRTVRMIHLRLT
jgi:hypothetical protein